MSQPKFIRKRNRLPHKKLYQGGYWYFVTICVQDKKCIFVESATSPTKVPTDGNNFKLNTIGKIVQETWLDIPQYYQEVFLDQFVIMPNHFHGVISLEKGLILAQVISAFKRITIKKIKQLYISKNSVGEVADFTQGVFNQFNTIWQKSFYDHIIRDEKDLQRIREYIQNNPLKWHLDSLNPQNKKVTFKSMSEEF
jgi:putative transposase